MCYNALDRHVAAGHGDQRCFLFEGNEPGRDGVMTYKEVLDEVCRVVSQVVVMQQVTLRGSNYEDVPWQGDDIHGGAGRGPPRGEWWRKETEEGWEWQPLCCGGVMS